METLPDYTPPIRLEAVVPGSLRLCPHPSRPKAIILKAQVSLAPFPDCFTVALHLDGAEAQRLAAQLQDALSD